MERELIRERVVALLRELLGEILGLEPHDIALDDELVDSLDVDSLQRLELMSEVEHELGIRLDAGAWREARTLAGLAELTMHALVELHPR